MRNLIKVMVILALIFASTFVIGRALGILTVENVRAWLEAVHTANPVWVVGLVVALLFADLFVAVPTLTITLLAGFFLGFELGVLAALLGMSLAAFCGYAIGWRYGDRAVSLIVKDAQDRGELKDAFQSSGPVMILLSRAAPIVPEVTACMAGVTRMPLLRYAVLFAFSTIPYVAIAAYAGSVSSVDDPKPAILGAIFLYTTLWLGWVWFKRSRRRSPTP
ncbi:MAG: VTT domain-containing protein [Pseudomonadota bacterium]